MSSPSDILSRPDITRRRSYEPMSPQEEFIVPLLRAGIEAQLRRHLGATNRKVKVLDVGCGAQPFRSLIQELGADYFSLDVSAQHGVQVDYLARLDDPHLDESVFQNGPYDLLLCSEVLEHIAEWDAAFANLEQLLAPSGVLILTAPHFFPLHEEPYDFWRPTPYAIKHFGEKYGLSVEEEYRLGSGWEVLGTLLARQELGATVRSFPWRVLSRLCKIACSIAFRILRSRRLQRRVMDHGPYFLANLQVLRRKSAEPISGLREAGPTEA